VTARPPTAHPDRPVRPIRFVRNTRTPATDSDEPSYPQSAGDAVAALRARRRQKLREAHPRPTPRGWSFRISIAAIALLVGLSGWVVVGVASGRGAQADQQADEQADDGGLGLISAAGPNGSVPHGRMVPVDNGCPPEASVCVDTRLRLSWLQQNGKIIYGPVAVMPGSAGTDGSVATPQGIFHVEWKDAHHKSSEYNEDMPNAVFFAPGGIAFHQGPLNSSSHGCVHLTWPDSTHYFQYLQVGAEVAVFGGENPPS